MKKVLGSVKKFWLLAALVGLMSIILAACGDDSKPAAGNTAVPAATVATDGGNTSSAPQEIKVSLKEWAIEPKTKEVKAGKLKISVSNTGSFPHDLVIQGEGGGKTPTFKSADGAQTLEVDLKPGTYKWICDLTGHADKGMTGELVVK